MGLIQFLHRSWDDNPFGRGRQSQRWPSKAKLRKNMK